MFIVYYTLHTLSKKPEDEGRVLLCQKLLMEILPKSFLLRGRNGARSLKNAVVLMKTVMRVLLVMRVPVKSKL